MKRILPSDWLSEQARWAHLNCPLGLLGISRVGPAKKVHVLVLCDTKSFIDKACLVKMAEYWPRSVFRFYGLRRNKEVCQYPAILTSRLVNNRYSVYLFYYTKFICSCPALLF